MEAGHAYPCPDAFVFVPPNGFLFIPQAGHLNIPVEPPPFSVIDPSVPPPSPSGVLVPLNPPIGAVNLTLLSRIDDARSMSLLQFIADERLVPSPEEEQKRKSAIQNLRQIVSSWIKKVALQRRLPKHQIDVTSATILTYGSYGLGVHSPESDIDALCVGPYFASMREDFFVVLHNMLKRRPEVSKIHCVKSAKVPLMRFKFDGISIDLPYARLKVLYVPEVRMKIIV
ncbi:hypothetical protein L6164_013699 [Bauhinia variegata]|uniref:Uncharacterized protein n=1 Tax=Bauhinia variegata TaxID=167791 RepID=A0ACB9NFX6_BAUVA|nr:hypothetical protein L6164_013699 [Bauhinia variegata]